jgi:hypothetical protein
VRIADYRTYAGKGGDFLGSALRVAPGDHDSGFWVFSMNTADCRPGIVVRSGGYGAGVEDNDACCLRLTGAVQPVLPELALDGGTICLSCAAAEICHVKSRHTSF